MSNDIAALVELVRHKRTCRANVMRGNYDRVEATTDFDAVITALDNALAVLT